MKLRIVFAICTSMLIFGPSSWAAEGHKLSEAEAIKLGKQAYIFGYPLITMDLTRQVMSNVVKPDGTRGPMGRFINAGKYPDASYRDVTAPNADTLYSVAWLNLSKEPYVLHVPDLKGRYYLLPMLSAWTNVFFAPGTRTTGTKAHDFAITGPQWKGHLPAGLIQVKSPTNVVWILGRTYCTGTPEDYEAVHKIQSEYKVTPLSAFGKPYTPPEGTVDPKVDMKTPVRNQVNALSAEAFFARLAKLMKENPAAKADAPMMAKLAKLGIIPGQDFDINGLGQDAVKGLEKAVKIAQEEIKGHYKKAGLIKNGWLYTTKTGDYGTDYLQRAFITAIGLGANLPQDAIYPEASADKDGHKFNGSNNYRLHFAKGQTPPVRGFWSLTMYDKEFFFVQNPLNRYTLSERNHLKKNADGSIDLYIQHKSPGADKESNWLPAPAGAFVLMFRFYWPKEEIIKGKWHFPAVEKY